MPLVVTADSNFLVPNGTFFVVLVVLVALSLVWLWALVDALRTPDGQWTSAGQSRLLWVLLLVFFHIAGTVLYLAMARPALRRAAPA